MPEPELKIKTSPGMSWFSACPDGTYLQRSFALGGGGQTTMTADSVAQFLARVVFDPPEVIRRLEDLGWGNVVTAYREILVGKEREKRFKRIDELRKNIAYAEPHFEQMRHKDAGYWVKKIMDDMAASPDYDPEDVSLRRIHQAAQSAMAMIGRLPMMKEELAKLLEGDSVSRSSKFSEEISPYERGTTS